jgi:hypothetical protein
MATMKDNPTTAAVTSASNTSNTSSASSTSTIRASLADLRHSASHTRSVATDLLHVAEVIGGAAVVAAAVNYYSMGPATLAACGSFGECVKRIVDELMGHAKATDAAADLMAKHQTDSTTAIKHVEV